MRRSAGLLLAALTLTAPAGVAAQATERQYLSGTDKDNTVPWEFRVTGGRRAGAWSTIPVPSNWELHGVGTYQYGGPAPRPDEQGRYRHRFDVPRAWRGKRVDLVFEGSMTDTEAWIDGKLVGPKHQGGFYEFRYDVTKLLRSFNETDVNHPRRMTVLREIESITRRNPDEDLVRANIVLVGLRVQEPQGEDR